MLDINREPSEFEPLPEAPADSAGIGPTPTTTPAPDDAGHGSMSARFRNERTCAPERRKIDPKIDTPSAPSLRPSAPESLLSGTPRTP
jgi:hypothetical protein